MDFFTDCEVAPIFLAQSDTTAGFLCADFVKLNAIKGRLKSQNTLLTLDSFCKLKNLVRIPEKYKNRVRRSTKNTFIYSGKHALSREGSENTKLANPAVVSLWAKKIGATSQSVKKSIGYNPYSHFTHHCAK